MEVIVNTKEFHDLLKHSSFSFNGLGKDIEFYQSRAECLMDHVFLSRKKC
jgi:hypothetical protein